MEGASNMGSQSYRSDEDWLRLINACRQSGLPDRDWCAANGIVASTFYNAIVRLRKKAYKIPRRDQEDGKLHDLTTKALPDVVPVTIVPESKRIQSERHPHLDKPVRIEEVPAVQITSGTIVIRLCNGTDPVLVEQIISSLVKQLC